MKVVFIERHGGPEVLKYGELPDPVPNAGEIVADVHATSVNAADWSLYVQAQFPHVLGRDFSGVVSAVGERVAGFRLGDAVFAVRDVGQEGAYAEKIAIRTEIVARKPASLGHVEAAALAVPGLTALIAIEHTLQLRAGETILIQGGAGGVGSVAIQLAKHIGAHVISTASAANQNYVRGLGADKVIDYNAQDFTKTASGCDAAFDTVGGDVAQRSFAVLKPGGRAAFIASGSQAPKPLRGDVQSLRPNVVRDRSHLERLVALFEAGVIRVPEVTRFPLSETAAAHCVSQTRHFRGKLVFVVR